MSGNSVFNITVCIIGILILLIHSVNLLMKKRKRKDELILLDFVLFTIVHFVTYLTFSLIKTHYVTNTIVIAFYTAFYIMNNLEVYFLFRYAYSYITVKPKTAKVLSFFSSSLLSIFLVLDILNIFTGFFFTASGGVYLRSKTMILSQGYQFLILTTVFFVAVTNQKLTKREKTAFGIYCFLPLVAIIMQNLYKGYAIAYASIIISIEILFLFLNVQKNIILAQEEEKNKEAQIKIMLSQIQPHFIYNVLSSISTLITIDPEKAQSSLDNFTEYLRHNLSSITSTKLIPFEDELKHIEIYIALGKMRFGDRLDVVYDIQTTDFCVPPLSIQPIVENAIKHGILKKLEGGQLTVKTYKTDGFYIVEVIDDGVGFCIEDIDFASNKHFGINNIKYRVEKICDGEINISSEIGKGTCVRFLFHQEEQI